MIHHLMRESAPLDRAQLCNELGMIGRVEGSGVPNVSADEWSETVEMLIRLGVVTKSGEQVLLDRIKLSESSEREQQQGRLF